MSEEAYDVIDPCWNCGKEQWDCECIGGFVNAQGVHKNTCDGPDEPEEREG